MKSLRMILFHIEKLFNDWFFGRKIKLKWSLPDWKRHCVAYLAQESVDTATKNVLKKQNKS